MKRSCVFFVLAALLLANCSLAEDASLSGFGLFKNKVGGWDWTPVSVATPIASEESVSGRYLMRFTVPIASLDGYDAAKARVGVVTGGLGTPPKAWVSLSKPYEIDSSVQSPWITNLLAQAVFYSANLKQQDGMLIVETSFDTKTSLNAGWDLYFFLDVDGKSETGFQGGDYLIQNTVLSGTSPDITVSWFEVRPGFVECSQSTEVTAWVNNTKSEPIKDIDLKLVLPDSLTVTGASQTMKFDLLGKQGKRIVWSVLSTKPGSYSAAIEINAEGKSLRSRQLINVVKKLDPKRQYQTATGVWLDYPSRPTLQAGNRQKISDFKALPSAKLKRNMFGITAHIPRSVNDEDPFLASYAVDGDPTTCWASRWWRVETPFAPEWLEIDLGAPVTLSEVRFLFAWINRGVPAGFSIMVSTDKRNWKTVASELDYAPKEAPAGDPLKIGDISWQRFAFEPTSVRYIKLEATRLTRAPNFFCSPSDPYQCRVSEVAAFDASGKKVDLIGKKVAVSTLATAWYNSPETIKKSWPYMLKSGAKVNRIGQWGDKTDWATVEKTKGVYVIDPELDRGITESVNGGVDIMMTLDYGNLLYQQMKDPVDIGPTWHRGHPFLQCAPTTPEAIQGFANYCAYMAKHFKGRVKYFEIWNEENGWFFDEWAKNDDVSTITQYGKALAAAAKAVKSVNPEAIVVVGGTAGSSFDFPRIALEEGAGPYIDAMAFHPYGHAVPEGAPGNLLDAVNGRKQWMPHPEIKDYEQEIAEYRKLFSKYNPKIQVWANEMNWMAPGEPAMTANGDASELAQAKYLARFYSINGWLGCGAVWWSLLNTNGLQEWAVLRSSDITPRGSWYSAGYVSTVLDDSSAATDVKVEVVGDAPKDLLIKPFKNGKGETIIGLWRKSVPDDNCIPSPVTVRISGAKANSALLVDTVYGYQQKATLRTEGSTVVAPDLLVGDWPLMLKFGK